MPSFYCKESKFPAARYGFSHNALTLLLQGWPDDWAHFVPFTGELAFEAQRRDDDRLAVWRPGRAEHAASVKVPAHWPEPGGRLRLYFRPAAAGVPLTVRYSCKHRRTVRTVLGA